MKARAQLMSPLLIIVMLFSLLSGVLTAAVVTTTETASAQPAPGPVLEVTILEPAEGAIIFECQNFTVDVEVWNTNDTETAHCVNATIDISGPASTADPLTQYVAPSDLGPWEWGIVSWEVHCDGAGPVTITVTPFGCCNVTDTSCPDANCPDMFQIHPDNLINASVNVSQYLPGLEVIIISPETMGICDDDAMLFDDDGDFAVIDVSQNFEVRAIVVNNLAATAEDVEASIWYDGNVLNWVGGDGSSPPHPQDLGDIDPDCAKEVAWTLHCKNAGHTEITVRAVDAAGVMGEDTIDVYQMIKVEITAPPIDCAGYEVCPSDTFTVKAVVTNTGADTIWITDVGLYTHDANITAGPAPSPPMFLEPDQSLTFTWTLHCLDMSDDCIIVWVNGTLGLDRQPVPMGYALYAYHQRGLLVDIVLPEDGDVFCECNDFYVNAVVTNTCDDTMYDVWAWIYWESAPGILNLGQGETSTLKFIGEIAGKTSADVWWELHCNGEGEALIYVEANGTTTKGEEVMDCDSVIVFQDILLEVEIIEPPFWVPDGNGGLVIRPPDGFSVCECDNFVVKANVTNIGCWPAGNVEVCIDIGPGAELAVICPTCTPPADRDPVCWSIGSLVPGQWVHVAWNLHCNATGVNVPISVYATSSTPGLNLNDTVIVYQGLDEPALNVTVVSPVTCDKVCTHCYNEFTVTAILSNPACALVQYAFAELQYLCGPGDVTILSPKTQGPFNIGGLSTHAVSWDVACNGEGDVTFWVEAWAQNVDPVESENDVTIHQKDFIVEITEVAGIDLAPVTLSTCQEFTITARFINCHETTQLVNLQAILDYSDVGAVPVPGSMVHIAYCNIGETCNETEMCVTSEEWIPVEETLLTVPPDRSRVILDRICPCCCAEVTWTLECVSAISGELTVTALTSGGMFLDEDTTAVTGVFTILGGEGFIQRTCCYGANPAPYCTWDLFFAVAGINMGIPDGTYCVLVHEDGVAFEGQATVWDGLMLVGGVLYGHVPVADGFQLFLITGGEFIIDHGMLYADDVALEFEGNGGCEIDFCGLFMSICQQWKPHLVAGLEAFPGEIDLDDPKGDSFITTPSDTFTVCENFTVVATVTNIGQAAAEDVSVTINVVGNAAPSGEMTQTIAYIPGGESGKVWWTLHCEGVGDVSITVTNITGIDVNTQKPIPEDNIDILCALHLHQVVGEFSVIIIQPVTCETYHQSDEFAVKALITNGGGAPIHGISATLHFTETTARLVTGDHKTKYIGTIDPGSTEEVSWMLHCDAAGDVVLKVEASATAPAVKVWSNEVIVHQVVEAVIHCKILSPAWNTWIATSQEFAVTAKIWNEDNAAPVTLYDAYLDFDPWDAAWQVGPSVPDVYGLVLEGGDYVIVTFTVHCAKAGIWCMPEQTTIWVNAWGYDSFGNYVDTDCDKWVIQYPAAHLVVDIIEPEEPVEYTVCDEFNVTAIVWNTGWCDAWEVSATLSVYPEGSVRVTSGGYTKYIGTLAGYWNWDANWAEVTWQLHCKQPCESTITVTATGKDECGWHKMWCDGCDCDCYCDDFMPVEAGSYMDDGDCEYQWVKNPGHHINEQFIEPDSITVKQMEAAAPAALEVVSVVAPEQVYVLTEFVVVVVVANNGGTDATGVTATMTVTGPAMITVSPTFPSTIAAGDEVTASWTLSCDGKGGVGLSVSVEGTDTNTAVGAATVQQTVDPDDWIIYLESISASLVGIEGCVCTINTTLGEMSVTLSDIHATLVSIEGDVAIIATDLGFITGTLIEIEGDLATIHTDLGNITIAIGDIELVAPDKISVNSWYWLIGPILGGFIILGVIVWFAVRKRPPAPPPPPTPGA